MMGLKLASAASRLGLGYVRSFSTLPRAEKNIYLVFEELSRRPLPKERVRELVDLSRSLNPVLAHKSSLELSFVKATHVLRRITFNNTPNCATVEEEEELPVEDYIISESCQRSWANCSTLGSKIIIPLFSSNGGGHYKHISWTDTSKRPIKFQVSSPTDFNFRSFTTPKYNMKIGEIDGKLYCFDFRSLQRAVRPFQNDVHFNHFEVFDPKSPLLWCPLDFPVRIQDNLCPNYYHTIFLPEMKKILISEAEFGDGEAYWFDVTKRENGWTQVSADPILRNKFTLDNPPFFVHNYHPLVGDFYTVFDLQPIRNMNGPRVKVFFMSNTFEFSQPINHFIPLPELSLHYFLDDDYWMDDDDSMDDDDNLPDDNDDDLAADGDCKAPSFTYKFIHLGHQKVALVLNKYENNNGVQGKNKGFVLLVTFEYDIITTTVDSKPNLEIVSRLLGMRRFQYKTSAIYNAKLMGAFLI